ncbi:hypothetical protein CK203_032995 [Vitis vinifera]|uniref:Uncharacterized protein n=1 Tax=Vitis vinifera TaxID=29760 RepID=A0A438HVY8_VITVI|nr:hypothetical protein CK203_032995 [Vitis vinifera]
MRRMKGLLKNEELRLVNPRAEMGLVLGENARAMRNIRHDSEAADVGTEASNFLSSTSHKLDAGAANGGSEHSLHNSHCGCCHCPFCFWAFEVLEGKFTGDSCTALEDFEQNPYNSSLSAIIPCHELLSAKPVFSDVSSGIYNLVDERSISLKLPRVCNPFSAPPEYQFQPESCPAGTIPMSKIPEVFTCSDVSGNLHNFNSEPTECLSGYGKSGRMSDVLDLVWIIKACHEQDSHFADGSVRPDGLIANMVE